MNKMDIFAYRQEINRIDDQLLALFCRRMELSAQIASCKKENGLPVLDETREREVLTRLCSGLDADTQSDVTALYNQIFQISRSRQYRFLSDPKNP